MRKQNLTFSSIPTTCYRTERPAFFHQGERPTDVDDPLEKFIRNLSNTVRNDRFTFMVDGKPYMAHPKWLRDHVHEMKAFKHWEYDLREYLQFMIEHQHPDGFFYEMVQVDGDYHTTLMPERCMLHLPESGLTFVRLEVEADIEYLVVEGAVTVYKATGDDDWILKMLPYLERGIAYCTSNPNRWDAAHGLVKRGFTIDTWDFMNQEGDIRYLTPQTPMSIMHGDNSGVYAAMQQLAWLNRRFGRPQKAQEWEQRATALQQNLNQYCFNGEFYIHQLHLNHNGYDRLENQRLSLSNAYNINRKITTLQQAQSILNAFQQRQKTAGTFAEWFTVDPPYPKFKNYAAGEYINGTIASLTAGELAKAAFENGQEAYGWDIIRRLIALMEKDGELYFMYDPKTGKNAGGGPSGWGAAAILSAIEEGLAGIQDTDVCFGKMRFCPRWCATPKKEVKYITGYNVSHTFVESQFERKSNGLSFTLRSPATQIACHILLPQGSVAKGVTVNGQNRPFKAVTVGTSPYADFTVEQPAAAQKRDYTQYNAQGELKIEIALETGATK